jgi:hypothetical protein
MIIKKLERGEKLQMCHYLRKVGKIYLAGFVSAKAYYTDYE